MERIRICFVCLGNICRSPTAEAVLRRRLDDEGLAHRVVVESAGTGDWHIGDAPDPRATAEARRRGVDLAGASAQFQESDFDRFDLILAMDRTNHADLRILAPHDDAAEKVRLLREFEASNPGELDVPDPYYGGRDGFAHTFDVVERSIAGLMDHLLESERIDPPNA